MQEAGQFMFSFKPLKPLYYFLNTPVSGGKNRQFWENNSRCGGYFLPGRAISSAFGKGNRARRMRRALFGGNG
jgi:hypothetical protein